MKVLASALLPSNFAAVLFLLGAASCLWPLARRYAAGIFAASGAIWLIFSLGPVAALLMAPLEQEFPAMNDPAEFPDVTRVVVLSAYATADGNLPLSSRMNASAAYRVLAAANVLSRCQGCDVIVSGGGDNAMVMAEQLRQLGVEQGRVAVDIESATTAESAERLSRDLSGQPIFLVTSAGHMRRAARAFEKQGIAIIPVPTDHRYAPQSAQADWLASPFNLQSSDLAIHEYLGLAWYGMTDQT